MINLFMQRQFPDRLIHTLNQHHEGMQGRTRFRSKCLQIGTCRRPHGAGVGTRIVTYKIE